MSLSLPDLVTAIDSDLVGTDGNALLRVVRRTPDLLEVGRRPIGRAHPLQDLLGFTAPKDWQAVGLRCDAIARDLPAGPSARQGHGAFTLVVARDGDGAGIIRTDEGLRHLPGVPDGVLGDALLRSLSLATAPPPRSTTELWLRVWLDRLVEATAFVGPAAHHTTWEVTVALHPAGTVGALGPAFDPITLADVTRRLAEAWPWSRLRCDPDVAETPHPLPTGDVAAWMDDGMFARWVLADLPTLEELADAVNGLLPCSVTRGIGRTVSAAGATWAA